MAVSPDPVGMGTLRPGEIGRALITLRNPHSRPIVVERVETSCPCVEASPVPVHVGPGEPVELQLTFDPSEEPEFRGGLEVEVTGFGSGKQVVFRTTAVLEVTDKSESRSVMPSACRIGAQAFEASAP